MWNTIDLARHTRAHVLRMTHRAHASHVGSCLSVIDILSVLYGAIMNIAPLDPGWPERDRLFLGKGHAAAALYATLAECGYFPISELEQFCTDGSRLSGHADHRVPGVEHSTGSLGHALPVAVGVALALRMRNSGARVFCVMSDGECQEGSVWEAWDLALRHNLNNLTVIVDANDLQALGTTLQTAQSEMTRVWIDGHDHKQLVEILSERVEFPAFLWVATVKGKGVSFMENDNSWHYRSPNETDLTNALQEIG